MFSAGKTYAVFKIGQQVVFIKTGTKHASKGGIELAVLKAFREVLLEVLSFRFGVAELALVHTVIYDVHKQARNQEKEIKVLSLSSNRKQLRYGG